MPTRLVGFVAANARNKAAHKSLPKDGRNTTQSTSVRVKFSNSLFADSLCFGGRHQNHSNQRERHVYNSTFQSPA